MKPERPTSRILKNGIRATQSWPTSTSIPQSNAALIRVTPEFIRRYLRQLGITENVLIHEQDYQQFIDEKGLTELGRGGEGVVYFTRGHVVKVERPESAAGALREVAHMLHMNRILTRGAMGERERADWPTLLWIYVLSDGSLSIGMRPFDLMESDIPGSTLYERLYCGPRVLRTEVMEMIRRLCKSLLYAHRQGIVHHDLKPANIYLPAGSPQTPIVFDLGQALWQHPSWGRNWLRHEHNNSYWYNGTYRYMHHQRRLAHLSALAKSNQQMATPEQTLAFAAYTPSYYDDVVSYARILRDIVKSPYMFLTGKDRIAFTKYYQRLMGLRRRSETPGVARMDSGIIKLLSKLRTPAVPPAELPKATSMEQVLPELEILLETRLLDHY